MRKGFTIFEVIVALFVFAMAVVGLMIALDTAISTGRDIQRQIFLRREIENRMAVLEGGRVGDLNRVTESKNPPVKFTETVEREEVLGTNKTILDGFWRVKVEAEWEENGQTVTQDASFLRFGQ